MADQLTIPIDMHAVSAQEHIQSPPPDQMPANAAPHEVQQFNSALLDSQLTQMSAQADSATSPSAVMAALAAVESKEAENKARILKMLDGSTEITATTVLEFNAALEERSIGYSFAKQMINAPSQWIKDLTSMQ